MKTLKKLKEEYLLHHTNDGVAIGGFCFEPDYELLGKEVVIEGYAKDDTWYDANMILVSRDNQRMLIHRDMIIY